MLNDDFRDLLLEFNKHDVGFLVVGAHALAAHGHVRATKDLDVWVRPTASNAINVLEALRAFGAPLFDLTQEDLSTPGLIFQVGTTESRIDVLTAIDGIDFETAWQDRVHTHLADQRVCILSKKHLLQNKLASGRKQDLADAEALERMIG